MAGSLVVAGGEGLVLLEAVEAAFDDVAPPVGGLVEPAAAFTSTMRPLIWSIRSGIVAAIPRRRHGSARLVSTAKPWASSVRVSVVRAMR